MSLVILMTKKYISFEQNIIKSKIFSDTRVLSKEYRLVAEKKIIQYTPGFNINDVRKKYNVNQITKLSSNENPFISDKVARYITKYKHEINLYPESKPINLAESIARSLKSNMSAKNIILGNGSNEILEFITRSLLDSSSEVIIPKALFSCL